MANDTAPILVGVLHDHQQPGSEERFTQMVQMGLEAVGPRLDRPVELVHVGVAGLPRGTAHAVVEAFHQLDRPRRLRRVDTPVKPGGLVEQAIISFQFI